MQKNFALRVFFVFGSVSALLGAGLWIFGTQYPILEHSRILTGGFLFGFSAGFLLTAIPVFLDSKPPPISLVLLAAGSLGAAVLSAALGSMRFFHLWFLVSLAVVLFTLRICFLSRKNNPPPFFVFVAFGIFCAVFGNFSYLFNIESCLKLARLFLFEGMILSFVIGIGSRILPVIFGYKESVLKQTSKSGGDWHIWIGALMLGLSFVIEAYVNLFLGRLLRALMIASLAVGPLKLYRLPKSKGVVAFFLWISMWSLIVGEIGNAFGKNSLSWLHLTYIGGFALMTFMVATHVLVEREHLSDALERNSKFISLAGTSLLLAGVFRFLGHLQVAAAFWCAAFAIGILRILADRKNSVRNI